MFDLPNARDPLAMESNEVLEVVDFSDLASYVGEIAPTETLHHHGKRPVASDFFEDGQDGQGGAPKPEHSTWRRGSHVNTHDDSNTSQATNLSTKGHARRVSTGSTLSGSGETSHSPVMTVEPSASDATNGVTTHPPPSPRTSRAPGPHYREAAMSTLDDVMLRIKGAMTDMHEAPKDTRHANSTVAPPAHQSSQNNNQVARNAEFKRGPAPLRTPQLFDFDSLPREIFDVTGCPPPKSPKPAWKTFIVRFPKVYVVRERVPHRQAVLMNQSSPIRWNNLPFDPVYGMRREFDLTHILPQFRKPSPLYKGKHKYTIALPRTKTRSGGAHDTGMGALDPRVNLPPHITTQKPSAHGAFGRSAASDTLSTWRKPSVPTVQNEAIKPNGPDSELTTVSRSPPPQPSPPTKSEAQVSASESESASSSNPDSEMLPKSDTPTRQQQRLHSKMPSGSAVAFYKNSRVVEARPEAMVNFIVGSEIDESGTPLLKISHSAEASSPEGITNASETNTTGDPVMSDFKSQPSSPEFVAPSLAQSKGDSSDDSVSVKRSFTRRPTH